MSVVSDPFDPARLRLNDAQLTPGGLKRVLLTLPVRKPSREWFVRVHPDEAFRLETCVIELKEGNEVYLVDPSLWSELSSETTFSPRLLVTAINRQGTLFLWPLRLAGADGQIDGWAKSSMEIATLATTSWVRVQSNMSLEAYQATEATCSIPDPEWPVMEFKDMLRVAFKQKFIADLDHPILQRLRGEV